MIYYRNVCRDFTEHVNVLGGVSLGAPLGDLTGRRAGAGEAGEVAARDRADVGRMPHPLSGKVI